MRVQITKTDILQEFGKIMKDDTVSSEFWATVHKGKLQGVSSGYPAHTLTKNQFSLSQSEFYMLRAIPLERYSIEEILKLLRDIQRKIKRLEKK